jgi:hypothetical protein
MKKKNNINLIIFNFMEKNRIKIQYNKKREYLKKTIFIYLIGF